jgi:Dolichyl-phosphate-mannose-protein mannosyltransferase
VIVLKLVGTLGLILATGAAALCVLTSRRRPLALFELLGLAPGLGAGLAGLGTFYLACWRVPLNAPTVATFAGGLLLGLAVLNIALKRQAILRIGQALSPKRTQPFQPFEIVLTSLIGGACLLVFAESLTQPALGFDARAIWGMKSKVIFAHGQIHGEDFFEPDRLHAKHRYPLGLPAAVGFVYHLAGGVDERVGKSLHALLFLALALFFYGAVLRSLSRTGALLGTCLLSTLPAFTILANGGAASGYSDVPLTYFYCVFALSLFYWVNERQPADFAVAATFGVFALFAKNEGLALWGIALVCFFLFTPGSGRSLFRRLGQSAWLAAITFGALAPWFRYQSHLPRLEEDYFRLLTPLNLAAGADRLPYLFESFFREFLLRPHLWSLLGAVLVLAFAASPSQAMRGPHGRLLLIAFLYCIFVLMIYLVIPWSMEELIPVSLTRLLMPLSPLLVFWLLLQAKSAGLLPETWIRPEDRAESSRDGETLAEPATVRNCVTRSCEPLTSVKPQSQKGREGESSHPAF